jgi:hypothetical protein
VPKTTPLTPAERRQIVDLYQAGVKMKEIYHATGRTPATVYSVLGRADIARRNAPAENSRLPCEVCGEPVRYIAPSQRSQGIGRFCSAACMGQAKRLPESRKADTACELLCTSCGKMKPPDDFYPHAKIARGRQYWCKECFAEKRRVSVPTGSACCMKYRCRPVVSSPEYRRGRGEIPAAPEWDWLAVSGR